MEKIRIQITKGYLLTFLFLVLGLFHFYHGVKMYCNSKNAVLLSELKFDECTAGQYVQGTVDTYVVKKIETLGADPYYGECAVFINEMGTEYHCYTIPIAEHKYIRIMVKDKEKTAALEEFVQGQGKGIYMEGEIVNSPLSSGYEWYKDVEGWEHQELGKTVHPQYVIKEISFQEKIKRIYIGIALLIAAIGCFKLAGGRENLIIRENSETERQSV